MAYFVCKKACYTDRRIYPGDVVDDTVQSLAPECFTRLKSVKPTSMKNEIEELIPQVAEQNKNRIKPISMTDLHNANQETKLMAELGLEGE